MFYAQINTTPGAFFKSSKRNDSSAFANALLAICKDPNEPKIQKSEILKTAGSVITDNTPIKSSVVNSNLEISKNSTTPLENVPITTSTPKQDSEPAMPTPQEDKKSENKISPKNESASKTNAKPPKKPIEKIVSGKLMKSKEIKKQNSIVKNERATSKGPIKPQKLEFDMKKPGSKQIKNQEKTIENENIENKKTQTEIETLRSRISNLNAKIRKLEMENNKLKDQINEKEKNNENDTKFNMRCNIDLQNENTDDSRRVLFLKDKIGFLQNQIDTLKKGLTFHKPIAYSTERTLDEIIGNLNIYFESRNPEFDNLKITEGKLENLRENLIKLQKTFSEKWKEYGGFVEKNINDFENEIHSRAQKLNEIEENLYKFGIMLTPIINSKEISQMEAINLQEKTQFLIESILTQGIEFMGSRAKSSNKEHNLAKQHFLQEFQYKKTDSGLKENFEFVSEKLKENLRDICYGIFHEK